MNRALWLSLCLVACEPEDDVGVADWGGVPRSSAPQNTAVQRPPLWGTSILTLSSTEAVVADTEADALHRITYSNEDVTWTSRAIALEKGGHPTRLADIGNHRVGVVLRGAGKVAVIDVSTARTVWTREVCSEPRDVAWAPQKNALLVTCASGELLTVTQSNTDSVDVGEGLRDVLIVNGKTWVTTFRTAQLLELNDTGRVVTRLTPPGIAGAYGSYSPGVAWRTVTDGTLIVMAHQLHFDDDVNALVVTPTVPYYGAGGCLGSAVGTALTVFDPATKTVRGTIPNSGALPVDVAFDGHNIALALAGQGEVQQYTLDSVFYGYCYSGTPRTDVPNPVGVGLVNGAVAVFDRSGWFGIEAPTTSDGRGLRTMQAMDSARALFHQQSPSGVACASCHAEGYDDGHIWNFGGNAVRTQSLEGGLLGTAPYHWKGELASIPALLDETLVHRMGGTAVSSSVAAQLGTWLDSIPARKSTHSDKLGEVYFVSDGCSACHSGKTLSDSKTVDVGTGGAFQVPSLRAVSWRGPWLHDGCAKTLEQRFSPECHGDSHAPVPREHVDALVTYLKSL